MSPPTPSKSLFYYIKCNNANKIQPYDLTHFTVVPRSLQCYHGDWPATPGFRGETQTCANPSHVCMLTQVSMEVLGTEGKSKLMIKKTYINAVFFYNINWKHHMHLYNYKIENNP